MCWIFSTFCSHRNRMYIIPIIRGRLTFGLMRINLFVWICTDFLCWEVNPVISNEFFHIFYRHSPAILWFVSSIVMGYLIISIRGFYRIRCLCLCITYMTQSIITPFVLIFIRVLSIIRIKWLVNHIELRLIYVSTPKNYISTCTKLCFNIVFGSRSFPEYWLYFFKILLTYHVRQHHLICGYVKKERTIFL